jgi:hypothetical protein
VKGSGSVSGFLEAAWIRSVAGAGMREGIEAEIETRIVEKVVNRVLLRFLWIDDLHGVMFSRNWQDQEWLGKRVYE